MNVIRLRGATSRFGRFEISVALDQGHAFKVIRQNSRRQQPGKTSSKHHGNGGRQSRPGASLLYSLQLLLNNRHKFRVQALACLPKEAA